MQYILNADDFGRTDTVNEAIVYGFENDYLSRTTIMVNMPCYEKAVELAKQHHFFDKVGLHINLVSGVPLTKNIRTLHSIVDSDGRFNGGFFRNKRLRLFLLPKERKYIKEEIQAQIQKYLDTGFSLVHADSHGHVHTFISIKTLVIICLKQNDFNSIRLTLNLNTNSRVKLIYKKYINYTFRKTFKSLSSIKYVGSFKDVLRNRHFIDKQCGLCEVMLHPNVYDEITQIGEGLLYSALDIIKEDIVHEFKN